MTTTCFSVDIKGIYEGFLMFSECVCLAETVVS